MFHPEESILRHRPSLDNHATMCHNVHMLRVSIRDLHLRTGEWVRRTQKAGKVVVTDRGRPVAALVPYEAGDDGPLFRDRLLLPEFAALPGLDGDSTTGISEDRDR